MDGGIEVGAVEDLVDADEEEVRSVPFEDREVVAGGELDEGGFGLLGADPFDEVEFAGH